MFEGERKRRPINLSDAFFAEEVADSFLTPEEIELIKRWRQEVDVLEDEAGQQTYDPDVNDTIIEEASRRVPGATAAISKQARIAETLIHKGGKG